MASYYECSVDGCSLVVKGRKLCRKHRARRDRHGDPTKSLKSDRGTVVRRTENNNGYVVLTNMWEHPNAWKDGRLAEHTYIMSEYLGRPLSPGENVHHKNGVRDDNRLENLELWSTSQPAGQRVADKTAWALDWLRQYAPETLKEYIHGS